MKRIIIATFMLVALTFSSKAYDFMSGDLCYNITGNYTVEVTYEKERSIENYKGMITATIPNSVINGRITYSVTGIGKDAFASCTDLKTVYIPSSVTNIDVFAFNFTTSYYYAPKLKTIIVDTNNVNYVSKEGVLFDKEEKTLICCPRAKRGHYIIPSTVISIGDYSFSECVRLDSITIPTSVTSIGSGAFSGCIALASVNIPNSVTSIGSQAFRYCSSLSSVSIPNSVTSIGSEAFFGCIALASVNIPNSVTSIGSRAFRDCSSLLSVTIPDSVASIGSWAFDNVKNVVYNGNDYYCPWGALAHNGLFDGDFIYADSTKKKIVGYFGESGDVVIPNTVTDISGSAFRNCTKLTSVTIPTSVTSIGNYAFYNCSGLTSVIIPNSVTSIGSDAFYNCSGLTSVTIPNSVTSIGSGAFEHCSALTSVTIPNSVASIGDYTFMNCTRLTSVTIPNSVTSIGLWAFEHCSALTSVTIPNSVTSIGDRAFEDVRHIVYKGGATGKPWGALYMNGIYDDQFIYTDADKMKIKYYVGGERYVTIPETVTSIGEYAFANSVGVISVTIPNSVNSIGNWAFSGVGNIYRENAEENRYGAKAQNGIVDGDFVYSDAEKTNLVSYYGEGGVVTIPNTVLTIGNDVFYGNTDITSVIIPEGVVSIERAFPHCSNLKSVTIPKSVNYIDPDAFFMCKNIEYLAFNTDAIGTIFADMNLLSTIVVGTAVTKIDDNTFTKCDITSAIIPASVEVVGDQFIKEGTCGDGMNWKFNKLSKTMTISGNLYIDNYKTVGDIWTGLKTDTPWSSFSDDIEVVVVEEGVKGLGKYAFWGCNNLKSVILPSTCTDYGQQSFNECPNLQSVVVAGRSVEQVNSYSFSNYKNCTLYVPKDKVEFYSKEKPFNEFSKIEGVNFVFFDSIANGTIVSDKRYFFDGDTVVLVPRPNLGYSVDTVTVNGESIEEGNDSFVVTGINENIFIDATFELATSGRCGNNMTWSIDTTFHMLTFSGSGEMYEYSIDNIPWKLLGEKCKIDKVYITRYVWDIDTLALSMCDDNTIIYCESTSGLGSMFDSMEVVLEASLHKLIVKSNNDSYGYVKGSGIYLHDSKVVVDAIPGSGYEFVKWSDGTTNAHDEFIIGSDITLIAEFAEARQVIVASNNDIFGSVEGGGTYGVGSHATINAVPAFGYEFVKWSNGSTNPTEIITVLTDTTLVAEFVFSYFVRDSICYRVTSYQVPYTVEVVKNQVSQFFEGKNYSYWREVNYPAVVNVDIPATVEHDGITYTVVGLGDDAFSDCASLKSIKLPNSIKYIGSSAFENCVNLGSVIMPNSVTSIRTKAFRNCNELFSIIIPESVKEMQDQVFSDCDNLSIYCDVYCNISNWDLNWNPSNCHVDWDYVGIVDESATNYVTIYVHHNVIVVENATSDIYVYDVMGRLVARRNASLSTEIAMQREGIYIVKCGNEAKRIYLGCRN